MGFFVLQIGKLKLRVVTYPKLHSSLSKYNLVHSKYFKRLDYQDSFLARTLTHSFSLLIHFTHSC